MPDRDLDIDPQRLRDIGHAIVDRIVAEYGAPRSRPPVGGFPPDEELERDFGGPLPVSATRPEAVLELVTAKLLAVSGNLLHPGWMAYVLSGSQGVPALAGALLDALNVTPYDPASACAARAALRWLGQMVGFGEGAAGHFTSGGTMANLMALAVARRSRCGPDVRRQGNPGAGRLVAYASEEAHVCVDQAMEVLGLGSESLRKIAVDGDLRMDAALLERSIERDRQDGYRPFCVVGTAGTVSTGAVDDLDRLADVSARHGLWLHVDGAYGAFAALSERVRPLFHGLARADSLVLDPHKWLNLPLGAGCLLVRRWSDLTDCFSDDPDYLQPPEGSAEPPTPHFKDCGVELSTTNRGVRVWLSLKQHGVGAYRAIVERHLELARYLADRVEESAELELLGAPTLSTCCFRYAPPELRGADHLAELNRLNRALEARVAMGGACIVSGTEIAGRRWLRACLVNHRTTKRDVDALLDEVRAHARPAAG